MKFYLFISIVFLSLSRLVSAQEAVYTLQFSGDFDSGLVPLEEVKTDPAEVENIFNNILTEHYKDGYIGISIDSVSIDSAQKTITCYLHSGKKFKWTRLNPGNADEGMLSKIRFRERLYRDQPLNIERLSSLIERVLTYYENNGHPFAAVRFDSFSFHENTAYAALNVSPGKRTRIDSINILSESNLPVTFISNYIGVRAGDLYSEKLIGQIPARIDELSFASLIRNPEVIFNPDKTILTLTLERQKANNIDGILGFQPQEDEEEDPVLTGEIDLVLRNSLGTGELLMFQWQRLQTSTQTIDVNIEFPYVFGTRFGPAATLNIYRQDTTFTNIDQRFGIQYYLKGDRRITGFVNRSSTNLINTDQYAEAVTLPENADVRFTSYGLAYKTVNVDYKFNPRKGFELYAEASAGTKNILRNPALENINYDTIQLSTNQYTGRMKFEHYIPFSGRLIMSNQLQGGFMFNENLFRNELFRIGGLHTLRGFDEQSIFASNFTIYKAEMRYILEKNSFVYLFFNGAWYERDLTSGYVRDTPYGFGAGVNFETKVGIFTINYALGRQFDNPVEMRTGKIHFGFANYF